MESKANTIIFSHRENTLTSGYNTPSKSEFTSLTSLEINKSKLLFYLSIFSSSALIFAIGTALIFSIKGNYLSILKFEYRRQNYITNYYVVSSLYYIFIGILFQLYS